MTNSTIDPAISEVLAAEKARCEAVMKADIAVLAELVEDDLVHVHVSALANDRNAYLEGVRSRTEYKSVTRDELKVRIYGDIAVVTGLLVNIHRLQADGGDWLRTKAFVTQVWRKRRGSWRQVTFQATLLERGYAP